MLTKLKKFLLLAAVIMFSANSFAQTEIEKIIKEGISLHDKGNFKGAVTLYNKVLAKDPNSTIALAELANTYLALKDYGNAIRYSDKVIDQKKENLLLAYMVKGTALDELNKSDEAITVYQEGLSKGGNHFLLQYNLGLVYYKIKDVAKAEQAFTSAVLLNPSHSSSHLMLGLLMTEQNEKSKSILAYFYFLLLEPSSERAKEVYKSVMNNLATTSNSNDTNEIKLKANSIQGFGALDLALELLLVSRPKELKEDIDQLEYITRAFFNMAHELKKEQSNFWWNFYVPFFYKISKENQNRVFCYFISQGVKTDSKNWVLSNNDKISSFINVLKSN